MFVQSQDPIPGEHPVRSSALDLPWQAGAGRPRLVGSGHPEREHFAPGPRGLWWYAVAGE